MENSKKQQNEYSWKIKNKRYLFELQKFLDLADNIADEKLKKDILYQFTQYDKTITEIAEEMIKTSGINQKLIMVDRQPLWIISKKGERKMSKVIIGIISGIISGTGMGGGTILIFLLTFICGIEQHVAQATNLIFFIPTSIIAILINIKNKNVDLKLGTIISLYGILGAIIGANLSVHTEVKSLRKYFGVFLIIIATHEIYSIIKQYKKEKNDKNKSKYAKQKGK